MRIPNIEFIVFSLVGCCDFGLPVLVRVSAPLSLAESACRCRTAYQAWATPGARPALASNWRASESALLKADPRAVDSAFVQ